jgi:hypothetical protein
VIRQRPRRTLPGPPHRTARPYRWRLLPQIQRQPDERIHTCWDRLPDPAALTHHHDRVPAGIHVSQPQAEQLRGPRTLAPDQARKLWNWTLYRQGLHPDHRLSTVTDVSHASLGLHAARLPSPYATVLARVGDPRVALTLLAHQDGLTTLRCMRKTLHLLPLDLAAAAHAATAHYRTRDAVRLAHNVGVPAATLTQLTRQLTLLLTDGPLRHRQIETALTSAQLSVAAIRVAMKLAWERGDLTYLNQSGCWNQEHRTFALTHDTHPDLNITMNPTAATKALMEAYFDRYGPATIKDAMWWSALSRSAITTAMNASETAWLQVTTPWTSSPAYLPARRYEQFLDADPTTHTTGLNLLAHEDVALKAYFETRDRYLNRLPARQAFNQIGEALPTIVIDGLVHGTWTWNPTTRAVTTTLTPGQSKRRTRHVRDASETLTDALRAGWRERLSPSAVADNQLMLAL